MATVVLLNVNTINTTQNPTRLRDGCRSKYNTCIMNRNEKLINYLSNLAASTIIIGLMCMPKRITMDGIYVKGRSKRWRRQEIRTSS